MRVSDSMECLLTCAYLIVIWNVYWGVDCVDEMCVMCGLCVTIFRMVLDCF